MPRSLSSTTLASMMAERAGGIQLQAAVIKHPASATIFRVVNNVEDIMHDGELFTAVGFIFSPPEESESGFTKAVLILNNVEQWLTPTIRNLSGTLLVTIYHLGATNLLASPPVFDTVDMQMPDMHIRSVDLDEMKVRCSLDFDDVDEQNFPAYTFSPTEFPGMFGALTT